jgi:hypothetical protein
MSRVYVVRLIRNYFSDFLATTRLGLLLCIWDTPIVSEETAVRQGPYLGVAKTLDRAGNAMEKLAANGRGSSA